MNPKQKAAYLIIKYMSKVVSKNVANECALVAVDEIMKVIGWEEMELGVERDNYWEEVKEEIQKA